MSPQPYSALVYSNLPDFELAKQFSEKRLVEVRPLLDVIRKHGMQQLVGVSLLHRHFAMYEDEILIRRFSENSFAIAPARASEVIAIPYVWAYSKKASSTAFELFPVEFIEQSEHTHKYAEQAEKVASFEEFLRDYFAVLRDRGTARFLGLALLPKHVFKLEGDVALIEDDAPSGRLLNVNVRPKSDLESAPTTQTLWAAGPSKDLAQWCVIHCGIHPPSACQIHCGVHVPKCQIHCGIHGVPTIDNVVCGACKVTPTWGQAVNALRDARDRGVVTRDTWESLVTVAVFAITDVNILAGLIAGACADCLTEEVFG